MFGMLTFFLGDDRLVIVDWLYREFGRRLRTARRAVGLTQADVAVRVGLSRTSLTNIERGRQHVLLHMLFDLASAVGKSPSELFPEKKTRPETDKLLQQMGLKEAEEDWVKQHILSVTTEENNEES